MMIRDGKIYRNLEEQVLKNMEDIEDLQSTVGSKVIANPDGVASDILNKLQVGDVIYSVDGGADTTWGQISGNLADQADLESALDAKQNKLTAGANITIVGDVISASGTLASAAWGQIAGNIADQADLSSALADKQDIIDVNHKLNAEYVSGLATVATTGSYNDLTDKPTTPVINYPVTDVEVNGNSVLVDTVAKITVPTDTADLTNGAGFTTNTGTVTSVRVQTGSGLESSTNTAQTTALDTTISIATGYKLPTTNEWNGKQDALPTVVNDRYLHTNASTGALEWSSVSGGGSGSTYTAGNGIDITNDVISLAYPSIIILEAGD